MAGCGRDRRRAVLAFRLLPGDPRSRRRAAGTQCGPRMLRRAGRSSGPGTSTVRARHEHLARIQHVGRPEPLHRRPQGLACPAVRTWDARRGPRSTVTIARRGRGDGVRNPTSTATAFQRYRFEHDYPAAIGSAGWFTHARRFVEWAEGAGIPIRLRDLDRPRARRRPARRLRPRDQRRPRRVLVGGPTTGGRRPRTTRREPRKLLGQHELLAGSHRGRAGRTGDGGAQVPRPSRRPGHRAGPPRPDDRDVGRSARRSTGVGAARRQLDVRSLPPLRRSDATWRRRFRRVPLRPLDARRDRARTTATCSASTTASSATRRWAARLTFDEFQLPVAAHRPGLARRHRDRRVHPVEQPGRRGVPGVDLRAQRPGRPRVHRRARLRRHERRRTWRGSATEMR